MTGHEQRTQPAPKGLVRECRKVWQFEEDTYNGRWRRVGRCAWWYRSGAPPEPPPLPPPTRVAPPGSGAEG